MNKRNLIVLRFLISALKTRRSLVLGNLALRQQLDDQQDAIRGILLANVHPPSLFTIIRPADCAELVVAEPGREVVVHRELDPDAEKQPGIGGCL